MLRRFAGPLLPLICLSALAWGALASSAGAVTVGISDNAASMFSERSFTRLNIRQARDIVYWNVAVMRNKGPLGAVRAWVRGSERAGVTPMISFAGNGDYVPSWPVYATAVKAFLHDFPKV